MYLTILFALLGTGLLVALAGFRKRSGVLVAFGGVLAVATLAFFWFLEFWGEFLWFANLGYGDRFWSFFLAESITAVCAGAAVGLGVWAYCRILPPDDRRLLRLLWILGAMAGIFWGLLRWEQVLVFLHRVPGNLNDPIFGLDEGFYIFVLPFLDALQSLALTITVLCLIIAGLTIFATASGQNLRFSNTPRAVERIWNAIFIGTGLFFFVLAAGALLDRYHLLFSALGVVTGPGWTDVHVRAPAYLASAVALAAAGALLLVPELRRKLTGTLWRLPLPVRTSPEARTLGVVTVAAGAFWFVALTIVPAGFQWLVVEPNEITFERPYIANNIEFTRKAYGLDRMEERSFPATGELTREVVRENQGVFDNIRLWDWRALDAVYKQFQEIRLYYEFVDVDIDRYHVNGDYKEVMVSARELKFDNLPAQSQTFVNKTFKYTHGYGLTMTNVSEFTPQGLPDLIIKNIPPVSRYESLEVVQPRIYYGEMTDHYVVANTTEPEFDYPRGQENAYNSYDGSGGVQLSSIWRKFLFGWKFGGTRFFLSGYPTSESRVLFHREIHERARTLAPFLTYDDDPYIVLADGRLYWILDAYTTTEYFPYSERFRSGAAYPQSDQRALLPEWDRQPLRSLNYVRNSVKIIIDAYTGSVDFYVFEPEDPLIRVWQKVVPGLFKSADRMPEKLRRHVRYPADLLLTQGLLYAKYHMTDPAVFYNQEDLWVRATEKYYGSIQPVTPYYIMWKQAGDADVEFSLILPFTPKNKQVLIGWIAGLSDGENYGRFLAYKFPKEKRVLGPQQVETKIDQDRNLSGQLTLWDQRGSRVIRGNVLAIPINETIFYVEPIYLQAETAAYPELRLVAVMHEDVLSYAETFDEALEGLFDPQKRKLAAPLARDETGTVSELISGANEAFEDYLRLLGEKEYARAAEALSRLEDLLGRLTAQQE